ncbi:hypothetical protein T492DRAFT_917127 [Pavlovales sp. CCMP2436]|nr:hypothetical protein T492DRAFT_917127 [Pavlovales sp. CCMP2436]
MVGRAQIGLAACSSAALVYMGTQASLLGAHAEGSIGSRARFSTSSGAVRAIRFGVIADVQHADAPDGGNYARTVVRHYRGALAQLGRAVHFWNEEQPAPLDFVANLGDVIDGMCAKLGQSEAALGSSCGH